MLRYSETNSTMQMLNWSISTKFTNESTFEERNSSIIWITFPPLLKSKYDQYYSSIMAIIGLACTFLIVSVTAYRYFLRRDTSSSAYSARALATMVSVRQQQLINLRRLRLLESFLDADDDGLNESSELCHMYHIRFTNRLANERSPWRTSYRQPMRSSDPPAYSDLIGCEAMDEPPPDYDWVIRHTIKAADTLSGSRCVSDTDRVNTLSNIGALRYNSSRILPRCTNLTLKNNAEEISEHVCESNELATSQTINNELSSDVNAAYEESRQIELSNEDSVLDTSLRDRVQECRDLLQQVIISVDRINNVLPQFIQSSNSSSDRTNQL